LLNGSQNDALVYAIDKQLQMIQMRIVVLRQSGRKISSSLPFPSARLALVFSHSWPADGKRDGVAVARRGDREPMRRGPKGRRVADPGWSSTSSGVVAEVAGSAKGSAGAFAAWRKPSMNDWRSSRVGVAN
jgi:hypothetical protein